MATPRYFFPPEWHPQQAVLLTWPHAHGDWAEHLAEVEQSFIAMSAAVCRFQDLLVSCYDEAHRAHVRDLLSAAELDPSRYHLFIAPSNDSWCRDHGPISVYAADGQRVLLDFSFNAWGGKYAFDLDNQITQRLSQQQAFGENATLEQPGLVLEGGAIETDGAGSLLATRPCVTDPKRNPALSQAEIEQQLHDWLGIERFLWLEHGALEGDDTDSHIDTLARFCDARTIAYVACDQPDDPHYSELQALQQELQALRRADGEPYRLVPLPWPRAKYNAQGERLPATYANFLIINQAVLLPTYRDPADALAILALQSCFPQREIIPINCLPLIQQFGSLHCVTMQLPASQRQGD